jgi:GNAT superfamily N-acetyltransferase
MGGGGWSFRRTLFGGDAVANRDDSTLVPGVDPAHIRAFYVDPNAVRAGIGTQLLLQSETDAAAHGFTRYEMMATLTGVPLYTRHGYRAGGQLLFTLPGGLRFPLVHMGKSRG